MLCDVCLTPAPDPSQHPGVGYPDWGGLSGLDRVRHPAAPEQHRRPARAGRASVYIIGQLCCSVPFLGANIPGEIQKPTDRGLPDYGQVGLPIHTMCHLVLAWK